MEDPSPIEILPDDYFAPLDLRPHFPRPGRPLHVDLGCGDGAFLVAMAARCPEADFLGIERLLGRVRRCCRLASEAGLDNVRLLRVESGYAIRYLLPPGSVAVFHLYCPDPWPKRRHWPKRLFTAGFLDAARAALAPGGELRVKTDDLHYFRWMEKIWRDHPGFEEAPWDPPADYPKTDFEAAFLEKNQPIYRTRLVLSAPSKNPSTP
jgi:tRNA (guanine-N7-)-methyltransferase